MEWTSAVGACDKERHSLADVSGLANGIGVLEVSYLKPHFVEKC
jgi:hypothetical protein